MSVVISKLNDIKKQMPAGYWTGDVVNQLRNTSFNGILFDSWYWSNRIISQLEYAAKLSEVNGGEYDNTVNAAIGFICDSYNHDGTITKQAALKAEEMISPLSGAAKSFKMICAAHAHIDMNWMWRWDETVAVALDTFRTMLDLMNEYPEFTFSQSQASVYRIVEEYAPEMLEEIKARIKDGRWEVTASTWVENDKNMPNGESMARHILYTKQYLSDLLDVDPDSLQIDFEPDTFGHSVNIPEILTKGGVKYYYHCRGYEGHNIYKWIAPSGKSIISYREPFWYNSSIESSMALYVPEFCTKYNMDTMLKVYGVGDHGGGPTRRDIERIIDMNTWPVFPQIRFGTLAEYFALAEKAADKLPEVKGELNFIFAGCYTSQSRIKMANRIGEATLNEAEAFNAISSLCTASRYSADEFARAWENVLFNHFHDIIPGSCIKDTREYAMGLFQKTMAIANTRRSLSMRAIAKEIDTSSLIVEEENIKESMSEGAGVGYGIKDFSAMQGERGRGKTRIFHIFNPATFERSEAVEITVWDWQGNIDKITFKNDKGDTVPHQLLDHGFNNYWGHSYLRVLINADVPACGYATYTMSEAKDNQVAVHMPHDPRVEKPYEFVLENELIKVTFDPKNASIISLVDKTNNIELADNNRPVGIFRLIEEDATRGGTAWVVGRYMNVENLLENVKIQKPHYQNQTIRQSIAYDIAFRSSTLKVTVSLDRDSAALKYNVECDWHEIGKPGDRVPQLGFYMPLPYKSAGYKYDVPFGVIERQGMDMDVPGNSFTVGVNSDIGAKSIMLITDSKYGFRGNDDAMSITLIRSSVDPDPYPEFGVHKFNFAVCLVSAQSNKALIDKAYAFNHPLSFVSDIAHKGWLPLAKSFIALQSGNVAVSGIKMPEKDGSDKLIVRVYETEGTQTTAKLQFFRNVAKAVIVDINEKPIAETSAVTVNGRDVLFEVAPYSVVSICMEFK